MGDVAMIAADTSRSRVYLQALAQHDLLPTFVIVLGESSNAVLPGQLKEEQTDFSSEESTDSSDEWNDAYTDISRPITELLTDKEVPFEICASKDINDPSVIAAIRGRPEPVLIYSGFGGALLRANVLAAGKRFLHMHGGYVPDFKGSTTNYYSLIEENTLGASAIFLSEEIDGGPVLLRRKFPPPPNRQNIDHVYDSAARARVLVEVLRDYQNCGEWKIVKDASAEGETYFIIHPVLKHISILGGNG